MERSSNQHVRKHRAMIKSTTSLVLMFILSLGPATSLAGTVNGFGVFLGYRYIPVDYHFTHDTHPDDKFLPDSNKSGSAGETSLDGMHMLAVGMGFATPIGDKVFLNFDAGALLGVSDDRHKNDNDPRPDENAAFVYSKGSWGLLGIVGASYRFSTNFYVGVDGQLAGIEMESGWDRYGEDEKVDSEFKWIPSVGPKIGFSVDSFSIEGTVQIGKSVGGGANLKWTF